MKIICPKHGRQTGGMQVSPDLAQFIIEGGERLTFRHMKYTFGGEDFPWEILVSQAFAQKWNLPKSDVVPCVSEDLPPWHEELAVICLQCVRELTPDT